MRIDTNKKKTANGCHTIHLTEIYPSLKNVIFSITAMDQHLDRPWFIQGVTVPIDPPVGQPPDIQLDDLLGRDEIDMYMRRYGSIRTYQRESRNGRISMYNYRMPSTGSSKAINTHLGAVFERQATSFKFNASIGAIMKQKNTNNIRYFHASANNYKLFDQPLQVTRWTDLEAFMNMNGNREWTEHAAMQMPNSSWRVVMVTNITMYIYHMNAHPIGGKGFVLSEADSDDDDDDDDDYDDEEEDDRSGDRDNDTPPPSKKSKPNGESRQIPGVSRVKKEYDNLCVFHCIAMDQEVYQTDRRAPDPHKRRNMAVRELFQRWWYVVAPGKPHQSFQGVLMSDLNKVEEYFNIGINVYTFYEEESHQQNYKRAILVRRPLHKYQRTMNVHMSRESHFDYIWSMDNYASSYVCSNCGQKWKSAWNCKRHENTCSRASPYRYKGGPYAPRMRFYEMLGELGIWIQPEDRYYEYRATYDLEACLVRIEDNDRYTSRHVPMSVSIASNVPGFEGPYCFISEGDSRDMVIRMIKQLLAISDEAYRLTSERMRPYIEKLVTIIERHEKELETTPLEAKTRKSRMMTPLQKAANRLESWMRSLPVVSFNGSRYDLQLIKPELGSIYAISDPKHAMSSNSSAMALEERTIEELGDCLAYMIKKGNATTCLATRKLTFLDVCNYIAPGYSYTKYLDTYGCSQDGLKSHFPYEYVTSLEVLNETCLPKYESFYSSLKSANTLEEGLGEAHGRDQYRQLQQLWEQQGMTSLNDLLIHYNNSDVIPLLKAIDHQVALFKENGLDMLKDAPSLPGLGLKFGMENLHGVFHTFGPEQGELAHLIYDSIVGGPSLVFCRYAEAGVTSIRQPDYGDEALTCGSIHGFDANSLYPWAMAQDQPVGPCVVRREPDFRAETTSRARKGYSYVSLEWLRYEAHARGDIHIQHAGNGPEVRLGVKHIPVDGFHGDSGTVFQFNGCLFHGHSCLDGSDSGESWLGTTTEERREKTQYVQQYIQDTCGYNLVTMWECRWNEMKKNEMDVKQFLYENVSPVSHLNDPVTDPGSDMQSILSAIREGRLFGMVLVDIHTPNHLRAKFRDMPPIFKCVEVGRDDIGDHMRSYCEETGHLPTPRGMLISSYFAVKTLLATPLLKWYLKMGLVVTRVYLVLQYQNQQCFLQVTTDVANKRRAADKDPSQKLAGESAKLLANSIYGKCCESKARFREITFVTGPAASAAVCSRRFRDMSRLGTNDNIPPPVMAGDRDLEPDNMISMQDVNSTNDMIGDEKDEDVYELSMAPRKIFMDLPVQIAFFVYAYAKLRMLEFRYEMFENYMDHHKWCPMYTDTDSWYVSVAGETIHDAIKPEKRKEFYENYCHWFPSMACEDHMDMFIETAVNLSPTAWNPLRECCMNRLMYDERSPGLFKTEWSGTTMIALCSKTYYCFANKDKHKFSCKGLQKKTNGEILNLETYRNVLTSKETGGGINRGIKATPDGQVYTYEQPRRALSYLYAKRRVLNDGVHTEPLDL